MRALLDLPTALPQGNCTRTVPFPIKVCLLRGSALPHTNSGVDASWAEVILFGSVEHFKDIFGERFPWHRRFLGPTEANALHVAVMTDEEDRVLAILLLASRAGHAERILAEVDSWGRTPRQVAVSRELHTVVKMVRACLHTAI